MIQLTSNYSAVPKNTIKLFRGIEKVNNRQKTHSFLLKTYKKLINANRQECKDANLTVMNMFCMSETTLRLGHCHKRNGSHNTLSKWYLCWLIFANLPGFRTTLETDVWARQ